MNKLHLKRSTRESTLAGKKIISILSGKGGVGKSVLTYNLADTIARSGKKVLVIDADMNFGNQHILANTDVEYGIKHLLTGELSFTEAVTKINENFYLLAASNGLGFVEQIDLPVVAGFINKIREEADMFDLILIDHSSGLNKTTSILAYASDIVVAVLVPELTSISDCYGLFKYLHDVDASLDCRFLVNRVETSDEAEYIYSKLCAVAERFVESVPKYLGFISEDDSFKKAVASQISVHAVSEDSKINDQLNVLVQKLLQEQYSTHVESQNIQYEMINKPAAFADIKE